MQWTHNCRVVNGPGCKYCSEMQMRLKCVHFCYYVNCSNILFQRINLFVGFRFSHFIGRYAVTKSGELRSLKFKKCEGGEGSILAAYNRSSRLQSWPVFWHTMYIQLYRQREFSSCTQTRYSVLLMYDALTSCSVRHRYFLLYHSFRWYVCTASHRIQYKKPSCC